MALDEDKKIDLSYLEDESKSKTPPRSGEMVAKGSVGKDFYESASGQGGTSRSAMSRTMATMSNSTQPIVPQIRDVDMKTVDVKCNYAKDRTEIFGSITLYFDVHGIAKMPEHQVHELRKIQRARPGRFIILTPEEIKPEVAIIDLEAPLASVVEKKPEVKVEETEKVEAPKAPKNTAKTVPTKKSQKKGALVKPTDPDKFFADKKSQK